MDIGVRKELNLADPINGSTFPARLPESADAAIDQRRTDWALLNRQHFMRCKLEVSNRELGLRPNLKARAIAVVPRRRGVHLNFAGQLEFSDAAEIFLQDFFLDFELVLVGCMLVVASTAAGEIRACRLDSVRRRLCDRVRVRAGKTGLLFGERGFDLFSGQNKWNEYSFAASTVVGGKASEAVAAVDELFNIYEQELILRHGRSKAETLDWPRPEPRNRFARQSECDVCTSKRIAGWLILLSGRQCCSFSAILWCWSKRRFISSMISARVCASVARCAASFSRCQPSGSSRKFTKSLLLRN